MCGITGYLDPGLDPAAAKARLRAMSDRLRHRGPDDADVWYDPDSGVGFGHRRLSILDLSERGRQPKWSHDGRYCICFNGEIYNFRALKQELRALGHSFDTHSDTEVLLEACCRWGVQGALERANGMFALALWDRAERCLYLARDRAGEKPLYYGWMGAGRQRVFVFGSELGALAAHPAFDGEIDRDALASFLRFKAVPAPHSIYRGIRKLPPAHLLVLDVGRAVASGHAVGSEVEPTAFWDARSIVEKGVREPLEGSDSELLDRLEDQLREAVRLRLESDVPLGAFLSGGIDSSLVVALMQSQSARPVRTFSIGFDTEGYDEAPFARRVAEHLGTEHTEMYVSGQQALDVVPRLADIYTEPFADVSQVPTFLVSQLARRDVTVALSGDGGDELFGGYHRYFQLQQLWRSMRRVPAPARTLVAGGLRRVPIPVLDGLFGWLGPRLLGRRSRFSMGDKLHKLTELLTLRQPQDVYLRLVSHWRRPDDVVLGGHEPATPLSDASAWPEVPHILDHMMYLDLITYLPDDILTKVDRASMAVGLECRVPLLDHHVMELAWRLPRRLKVRQGRGSGKGSGAGQGKWALRQILARHLPIELIERPKMGFGVPLADWLRGPLRPWAEELLDERRLRDQGWLQPEPIRQLWADHLGGQRDWHYWLWDVLVFQQWLERHHGSSMESSQVAA